MEPPNSQNWHGHGGVANQVSSKVGLGWQLWHSLHTACHWKKVNKLHYQILILIKLNNLKILSNPWENYIKIFFFLTHPKNAKQSRHKTRPACVTSTRYLVLHNNIKRTGSVLKKNTHWSQTKKIQLILIKPHLVAVIRCRLRLAATQQSRAKIIKLLFY